MNPAVEARTRRTDWARHAPLTGVGAVLLVLMGALMMVLGADEPGDDATPQEVLAFFKNDDGWIFGATFLAGLGLLLFIWFLSSLRSRLLAAEGGTGRLATIAFGGGVATAILLFAAIGPLVSGAGAVQGADISPEAAQALWHGGDGYFPAAFLCASLPLFATAIVVLRTRTLPRWLGWASAVLGILMLIPFVNWLLFGFVFPLWVIVMSLLLWRDEAPLSVAR
jgi:hypothetical protein